MYFAYRNKFSATVVASVITPGTAVAGHKALATGAIGGAPWTYLLEDGSGGWEIGVQLGDSARTPAESSGGSADLFGTSATGLTCTLISPVTGYVSCDGVTTPPVTLTSADALAIGRGAGAPAARAVAIGVEAGYTTAEDAHDSVTVGYRATSNKKMSIAVGSQAKVAHPSESVLGSFNASHISSIAVTTDSPSAGGTFPLKSIAAVDAYGVPTELVAFTAGVAGPTAGADIYATYMIRVQGTIFAQGSDANDRKVFNVDYATYEGTSIYSSITALFTGSNTPSITLAVNASEQLEITVAAGITTKVSGVLRVDKLFFAA